MERPGLTISSGMPAIATPYIVASQFGSLDDSLPIKNYDIGDAVDIKPGGDLIFPPLAVKVIGPLDFMLHKIFIQSLTILIQADPNDLKSFVVIVLVYRQQVGRFGSARPAPGGPEINQDNLAFQLADIDSIILKVREGKFRQRLADDDGFLMGTNGRGGDFSDRRTGGRNI